MATEIRLDTVPPCPTAVVAASTSWAEFPTLWPSLLDKVWGFLSSGPEGLYDGGHNVMLYKDDAPSVEVGVQVTHDFDPVEQVRASSLPGGLVATATHTGPVAELANTHHTIRTWCSERDHRLAGPRWEIYGDPQPDGHFDVEVCWLLATPDGP